KSVSKRADDQAGRPGPEAESCLWLLVRLWRRLVSSSSSGPDRACHPDRHLPTRHKAGGQVSAAVLRRVAATRRRDTMSNAKKKRQEAHPRRKRTAAEKRGASARRNS